MYKGAEHSDLGIYRVETFLSQNRSNTVTLFLCCWVIYPLAVHILWLHQFLKPFKKDSVKAPGNSS